MKSAEAEQVLSLLQTLNAFATNAPLNTTADYHAGWQARFQHVCGAVRKLVDQKPEKP